MAKNEKFTTTDAEAVRSVNVARHVDASLPEAQAIDAKRDADAVKNDVARSAAYDPLESQRREDVARADREARERAGLRGGVGQKDTRDRPTVERDIRELQLRIEADQRLLLTLQHPPIEFPKMVLGRTFASRQEQDAAGPDFADK